MSTKTKTRHLIKPPSNRWIRRLKKLKSNKAGLMGVLLIFGLILVAISADYLAPFSYKEQDLGIMNSPPSLEHLMGTDEFGRDVFSRILNGSRISVYVGVVSVGLSVLIGVILGALAGYYGGRLDQSLRRRRHRPHGRVLLLAKRVRFPTQNPYRGH